MRKLTYFLVDQEPKVETKPIEIVDPKDSKKVISVSFDSIWTDEKKAAAYKKNT